MRITPMALFVLCVVAATPFSWGANRGGTASSSKSPAAMVGRSQVEKLVPIRYRWLEIVDFLTSASGLDRARVKRLLVVDDMLPSDASVEPASTLPAPKRTRLIAPIDPVELGGEFAIVSPR